MNTSNQTAVTLNETTNLGELIAYFYDQFIELYGDPDLASVAAAAVINDMLADAAQTSRPATSQDPYAKVA